MARFQVPIIALFFISANTYYIFDYIVARVTNHSIRSERITLAFGVLNFLIELLWGISFCTLWKFISDLIRYHDKTLMTRRQRCLANSAITVIMILYFSASFVFELFDPVMTYRYEEEKTDIDWLKIFYQVYYLRFMFDFVSCMLILYLMYRFGTRSNEVIQRRLSTHIVIENNKKQSQSVAIT